VRQQYSEAIARQSALKRVLQHLEQAEKLPGIEPEFYRYREALVQGELARLQAEIERLQDEYPNLRNFTTERLQEELLAIEAETYAELVRSGRLNKELAPFLPSLLVEAQE
jgi:CPA1 family monovalent cation:H+ antiporter